MARINAATSHRAVRIAPPAVCNRLQTVQHRSAFVNDEARGRGSRNDTGRRNQAGRARAVTASEPSRMNVVRRVRAHGPVGRPTVLCGRRAGQTGTGSRPYSRSLNVSMTLIIAFAREWWTYVGGSVSCRPAI